MNESPKTASGLPPESHEPDAQTHRSQLVQAEPVAWRIKLSNKNTIYEDRDPRTQYTQRFLDNAESITPLYVTPPAAAPFDPTPDPAMRMPAEWDSGDPAPALRQEGAADVGLADARDAARYRWLRAGTLKRQGVRLTAGHRELLKNEHRSLMVLSYWCAPDELDAAIDDAMKAEAPKEQTAASSTKAGPADSDGTAGEQT